MVEEKSRAAGKSWGTVIVESSYTEQKWGDDASMH